jgi:hypothetical protein
MSFCFLLGPGHLSARAAHAARDLDAELVNYTDERGGKRHWFTGENYGAPFDGELARSVRAAVMRDGTDRDRQLLTPRPAGGGK